MPDRHEAINEETAYLMLNLMQGVINEGTGARLRNRPNYGQFKMPIAGKTGTTQNHSDGWFIGVTPKLSAGVGRRRFTQHPFPHHLIGPGGKHGPSHLGLLLQKSISRPVAGNN